MDERMQEAEAARLDKAADCGNGTGDDRRLGSAQRDPVIGYQPRALRHEVERQGGLSAARGPDDQQRPP